MNRAFLLGNEPPLGYEYVKQPPFDTVVIGSLTLWELLHFSDPVALSALSEGKRVILYTPGLPQSPKNRALAASLASCCRELKNWGVIFTDGGQKRIITAQEAKQLRQHGLTPPPGSILTPLAKEILEE